VDWPLQIGQKLIIQASNVTPSPTPRPLTPIEKITPASDGKYYHTIQSGETLAWVANLYEVWVYDLMSWNGLNETSILQPGQKLLLQVTPPATATWTPAPPTTTATETSPPPTPTPSSTATQPEPSPTQTMPNIATKENDGLVWIAVVILMTGGTLLAFFFKRKLSS
jgi:LysM repeat protein